MWTGEFPMNRAEQSIYETIINIRTGFSLPAMSGSINIIDDARSSNIETIAVLRVSVTYLFGHVLVIKSLALQTG